MKALLISRDAQLYAEIASLGAGRAPPLSIAATRPSLREALERLPADAPELVIIDASDIDEADADQLDRLGKHYVASSFILLTGAVQQQLLIRAMRAGVREVLHLPLVHQAFHEALDRIANLAGATPLRDGKVIAIVSCKGGSGATFVATNFGYALSALADKKVLLIDLHGQFGDAVLYVSDQKPAMTLLDVCNQAARVDGPFLDSCLVHVAPGFGVLAAADDPGQAGNLKPEQMDTLLRVARQHYDYVMLDVGRQIDAISLRALDNADAIYPVLQLELSDLRHGRRLLETFRSLGYPPENTRLIVNRYEKGGKLRLQDVHSALGVEVLHSIPNDYLAVSDAVNQGVPALKLSRSSAVSRSLSELVEVVTAHRVTENKGLFERIFKRGDTDL